jgi:hypothetical protein
MHIIEIASPFLSLSLSLSLSTLYSYESILESVREEQEINLHARSRSSGSSDVPLASNALEFILLRGQADACARLRDRRMEKERKK